MSEFRPAPKPVKVEKVRKYLPRSQKPLKRSWLKRGTKPIPAVNQKRMARRKKAYSKVIGSVFHKALRYLAYERSGGLCECERCVEVRRHAEQWDHRAREMAFAEIPIWFTKGGGKAHLRFRSDDGELHHTDYKYFGEKNPDEIHHVQWVWKDCHKRIEAEKGTRNRYLRGLKK